MGLLPRLKTLNQSKAKSDRMANTHRIIVDADHADGPIAVALVKQHGDLPKEDHGRLRVILLKEHDTGGMASWNIGEHADIREIAPAISADVVADARKSGPGHYDAVIAAKTILQTVPFIVPYEIVESMPTETPTEAAPVPESA